MGIETNSQHCGLTTHGWLDALAARCDKRHTHKSWKPQITADGVFFPTSAEAAYPFTLCQRIIDCLKQVVLTAGAIVASTLDEQILAPDGEVAGRIALGAQPRGLKLRPLVAEFGCYRQVVVRVQDFQSLSQFLSTCPKGSRITSRHIMKWGKVRASVNESEMSVLGNAANSHEDSEVECCWIGTPSDPEDFLHRAISAGHPRGLDVHIDADVQKVVAWNILHPPFYLAKRRVDFFKKWCRRARELETAEANLKKDLPEHIRQVLANKRILLLKEILEDCGYGDSTLIDDLCAGFPLSGYMPRSNVFRSKTRRPAFSTETLHKLSKAFNSKTTAAMAVRQEESLEEATWNETQSELQKGWIFLDESGNLEGKFFGRRFGLDQGSKVRVIDDCSCCGLNATVGLREKFKLHTVDFLAAILSYSMKRAQGLDVSVKGRVYDLKSAYKQLPIRCFDRDTLRMGVNVPGRDAPAVIGFNSLPFGAVGSVAGFLRTAHAVWHIGFHLLGLLWSSFYDDFTVISRDVLEKNTSWACESLFDLLGFVYAKDGKKFLPFSEFFKMLGLRFNVEPFGTGKVLLGHTDERREELCKTIDGLLGAGRISSKDAERLRGRMVFFEGFAFGRVANSAVKSLGRLCTGGTAVHEIDAETRVQLEFLKQRVLDGPPLSIEPFSTDTWFIFTDGACEPDQALGSVGGVILDQSGKCINFFGEQVPASLMEKLMARSKNPIHDLEVLPIFLAATLWGGVFKAGQVVYYVDNESARMAYIRGSGETPMSSAVISRFVILESQFQHKVWFARVPSHSNLADAPSRLDYDWVRRQGASQTSIDWERVACLLQT